MRLYNTEGAAQVDDPEYGTFKPGETGAFDGLPDGMYTKLFGRPGWESEEQRTARLVAEQMEKLRDPATMLAELQKMTANQSEFTALLANALGMAKAAEAETAPAVVSEAAAVDPEAESAKDPESPAEDDGELSESEPDAVPAEGTRPARAKTPRASKKAAAAPPAV